MTRIILAAVIALSLALMAPSVQAEDWCYSCDHPGFVK